MIGSSKNKRQNYPGKYFWTQEKETRVKFNPGLSANRPSNNWALKGKTHLYMWNQLKCHNQSHEQWFEKNYPHMFNKFPDILKSRLLTYMCYKQKKHTTLDMLHSCVPSAEFTLLIDQRGPVWSHVVKMPVTYTPLNFLCILCNAQYY